MPTFKFEAMDTTGSEVKDSIEALNEEEAQQKIKQMGYFVTKLTAVGTATKGKGKGQGLYPTAKRCDIPADDKPHNVEFDVDIAKSSRVAIRHFPQMHTNAVNVIVGGKPIRASRESAKWCIGVIEQLWKVRGPGIKAEEREEADKTFKKALEIYKKIVEESEEGS
jgi:hypothetical protein